MLDGCPAFTPEEMEELVAGYLPPFRPVWDGSHVAWLWSRVRDQLTFFPWYRQGPASRLAIDMPRPSILNRIATDLLLAGDGYRVAYEAAFRYDGAAAAAMPRACPPTTWRPRPTFCSRIWTACLTCRPTRGSIESRTRSAWLPSATCWARAPPNCRRHRRRRRRRARAASFRWTAHR